MVASLLGHIDKDYVPHNSLSRDPIRKTPRKVTWKVTRLSLDA